MGKENNPLEEPSVLDYLKALWNGSAPAIPPLPDKGIKSKVSSKEVTEPSTLNFEGIDWAAIPWRTLSSLFLAVVAQYFLEPPNPTLFNAFTFYTLAAALLIWAIINGELQYTSPRETEDNNQTQVVNSSRLLIGAGIAIPAFWLFGGNHFTFLNVTLWVISFSLIILALWWKESESPSIISRIRTGLATSTWNIPITRFGLLIVAALLVSVYFRVYQLNIVPGEMFSDHIEKLLDIYDVQEGQKSIFFPRNTGREGLQMYVTSWIIDTFQTGYSFLSLKIGTVFFGLFMLPYMYLLGKEVGNRNVGLIAMILCGVAFWPNILARVGLRHILYSAFAAPTFYYLFKGLRTANRNDFILSGIALGIGLHGYSPIRVLPIILGVALILFIAHTKSIQLKKKAIINFGILAFVSLIIFLPLLRYALEEPTVYNYRGLTRVTEIEQAFVEAPTIIFLNNLWDALLMINVTNSSAWVVSLPNRPMLDAVSASLFLLGVVLLAVRYIRHWHWLDLFLLVSIPLLMMPSILSIAFPIENPTANRAGGAMVPVFIIAAIALDSILRTIKSRFNTQAGSRIAFGLAFFLVSWSALMNFNLTFNKFAVQFARSSWNTTEMGEVIAQFTETVGAREQAWVVVYPHWADNRLVAINSGLLPTETYELYPENIPQTLDVPGPKLFLVKPEDVESLATLQELYPQGLTTYYSSKVQYELKDFYIFYVLPEDN